MMSLSVLTNGDKGSMLYDSESRCAILIGEKEDLFEWKNRIELAQEAAKSRLHREQLKQEYVSLLVAGGNTKKEAINFLKAQMPGLWQ